MEGGGGGLRDSLEEGEGSATPWFGRPPRLWNGGRESRGARGQLRAVPGTRTAPPRPQPTRRGHCWGCRARRILPGPPAFLSSVAALENSAQGPWLPRVSPKAWPHDDGQTSPLGRSSRALAGAQWHLQMGSGANCQPQRPRRHPGSGWLPRPGLAVPGGGPGGGVT